jgi:hypothetical protein
VPASRPGPGPLVEQDEIFLAGPHGGEGTVAAVKPEADCRLVVGDRAVEVAHHEVHRAEARRIAQAGGDRGLRAGARRHVPEPSNNACVRKDRGTRTLGVRGSPGSHRLVWL